MNTHKFHDVSAFKQAAYLKTLQSLVEPITYPQYRLCYPRGHA